MKNAMEASYLSFPARAPAATFHWQVSPSCRQPEIHHCTLLRMTLVHSTQEIEHMQRYKDIHIVQSYNLLFSTTGTGSSPTAPTSLHARSIAAQYRAPSAITNAQ